ncbi:hypothetical protein OG883_40330 [Streptomyces sp. NBC_01142]|uniref:hypothetical protein n=1 Tax=Streptomyces sp. NBC_01142 TaxID=2975865 RepID=UPI0022562C6E|nr:hypothetical protein [Streptomyces sp. NBC_01142]MCX4825943.1 hypothetical protein [Streptomyces sp. NBC_01142]
MADDSIKGPVGYRGSIETPTTIRVGDLIVHDHVYFAVADMVSARNGIKILHFQDREPLLVEGPTTIYRRQVAYMVSFGEIVYSRSCPTDSAPAGGPPLSFSRSCNGAAGLRARYDCVPSVEVMTWGVVSPGPWGAVGDADERSGHRLAWRNAGQFPGGRSA